MATRTHHCGACGKDIRANGRHNLATAIQDHQEKEHPEYAEELEKALEIRDKIIDAAETGYREKRKQLFGY